MSIRVSHKSSPFSYEPLEICKSFIDPTTVVSIQCEGLDAREAIAMMGRVATSDHMDKLVYFFGDEANFVLFNHSKGPW